MSEMHLDCSAAGPKSVCDATCRSSADCSAFAAAPYCAGGHCGASLGDAGTTRSDGGETDGSVGLDAGGETDGGVGLDAGGAVTTSDAGVCGNVCGPATVASGQPNALAVDATSIYWSDGGMTLMSVPVAGGSPVTLASSQSGIRAIALDATSIYWVNSGTSNASGGSNGDGSVMKVLLGGGAPITLAASQSGPVAIAVDGTSVYWVNSGTIAQDGSADGGWGDGSVMKVSLGGGVPSKVAPAQSSIGTAGIAVDATSVYWTNSGSRARNGTLNNDGSVMKAPLEGGVVVTLASGQSDPNAIAVDATSVYWARHDMLSTLAAVMKVPLGGGAATTLAIGQNPYGSNLGRLSIAVDATSVYWTDGAVTGSPDGLVMKAPLGGGTSTTLASGQFAPGPIAVHAASVYWVTHSPGPAHGGTVWKLDTACRSHSCN